MTFSLDTNIVIDLLADQSSRKSDAASWSIATFQQAVTQARVIVSIIVFSEISIAFASAEATSQALKRLGIADPENPSLAALHLAGTAHAKYRRSGGLRERTLPDFIIGADASDRGATLITCDTSRYATYFPDLKLIAPPQ